MDDALSDWLTLREAVDAASRSESLTRKVVDALPADSVRILDLGTGAGSNVRFLAPRLPPHQDWLVVDRSAVLLSHLMQRTSSHATITTLQRDLNTVDGDLFAGRHLVTASALLDLASESWLRSVVAHCRAANAVALFTIIYNGRSSSSPHEPEDDMVLDLFNRHQHTDKGLGGPAAGPDATDAARRAFADEGYRVEVQPSDWVLDAREPELQRQLIDGWRSAATEMSPESADVIARWHERRIAHVNAGRSRIVIGHFDLAAFLQDADASRPRGEP